MKHEIKDRYTNAVLYTAELPDDTPGGLVVRHALEKAARDGANLDGANLDGANLAGANLAGAYLDGAYLARAYLDGANLAGEKISKAPLSILNLRWPVLITEGFMRIGCKRYTHAEWREFDEAAIRKMDSDAFDFWKKWRAPLLAMCEQHAKKEPQ